MKKFLLLAILFFITSYSKAQWYKLPGPNGGDMYTLARVGNEIWTGGFGGLYVSSNEGFSWQKSPLLNGMCNTILSYNDTVVICYTIVDGFDYSTYSISSFNLGVSWTTPILLDQPYSYGVNYMKKSDKGIFFFLDFNCKVSYDGGVSWATGTTQGGDIYEIYTDGTVVLATVSLPAAPYEAYYYSADGNAPWTLLSSSGGVNQMLASNNRIFMINYWMGVDSLLITDDFGVTWDTINTGATSSMQSMFKYNNTLYLTGPQDSLVSTDNGSTWSPGNPPAAHWLKPGVFTTAGNWLYSDNGAVTTYFSANDTSVITNTGIVGYYMNSLYENNNVLFTSGNNQLYRSVDGGLSWLAADSIKTAIETMFFAGDSIYAVDQNNGIFARSYDNGINWFTDTIPIYTGGSTPPGVTKLNGTIYINGYKSFYSNDEGVTWDTLTVLPTSGITGCFGNTDENGTVVSYFGSLFSFSGSGHLFRYDTSNNSWTDVFCWEPAGAWPQNYLTKVDNYLVLGNVNHLFVSADSGSTWVESLYGGLPVNGSQYYVPKNIVSVSGYWFCTEGSYGVYYSTDHGMSWTPTSTNPEIVPTQGLVNLNGVLYTIGFYNGVWRKQYPFFTLAGKVYHDNNNNSTQDAGEDGLSGRLISTTPASFTATTDTSGNYLMLADMPGTISTNVSNAYVSVNPATYSYTGAATNLNFGLYIAPGIDDVSCDITNINVFSPGFQTNIHLTIANEGSFAAAPQLRLILDSALLFDSSTPAPDAIAGDTLLWNFGSLDFLDQADVNVLVTTNSSSSNGDTLHCMLEAFPVIGDTTPANNISILEAVVVGSFDPNDKTCVQGDYFTPAQLANGEELQYIIRFQNTGTAPTSFITVTDSLSPLLDFSTFRMISSSHPCTWNLSGWGNLNVEFNPIALPSSGVDEPGSHGYFKYGIQCREAVTLGNAITNTAAIYFDFNTPIITNTVTTLIFEPTPVTVPEIAPALVHIIPYPNPTFDHIRIKFSDGTYPTSVIINVYDIMGRHVITSKLDPSAASLNVSSLNTGIYFSVLTDQHGKRLGDFKFTKVK